MSVFGFFWSINESKQVTSRAENVETESKAFKLCLFVTGGLK